MKWNLFFRSCIAIAAVVTLWLGIVSPAPAGGGPENVLLVVNKRSWASKTIANHYQSLRKIPDRNVVHVDWKNYVVTDIETFREGLLKPVLATIEKRGLGSQINYIVYSSDFPYEIDFQKDLERKGRFSSASINGLTYLWQPVMAKDARKYTNLRANAYYRKFSGNRLEQPPRGFDASQQWSPEGEPVESGGQRYYLSVLLGYTSGRGNSINEVINHLRRSTSADGTQPQGTIYYVKNDNIRSRVRDRAYEPVVKMINDLGVRAEIVEGIAPEGKSDVMGAMTGCVKAHWKNSNSRILPGAVVENLTSYGGILKHSWTTHTLLSEFIRYGAAGSSGTVVEPYAIQAKFPHPTIQYHYASGCNLAEAFYQSVNGPYQLLIIGDPLCAPWARTPLVLVKGIRPREEVRGTLTLTPSARTIPTRGVKRFELYVDGQLIQKATPGEELTLDTTSLPDGHHELRIVAVDDSAIATRGRIILPVRVNNRGERVTMFYTPQPAFRWGTPLRLEIEATTADSVVVTHQREIVGRLTGNKGVLSIDPRGLGLGPVTLQAIAVKNGKRLSVSKPLEVEIEPERPLRPTVAPGPLKDGLVASGPNGLTVIKTTSSPTAKGLHRSDKTAGIKPGRAFRISGYVHVEEGGVHQFVAFCSGSLQIRVGGRTIFDKRDCQGEIYYAPVNLRPGLHRIEISGLPTEDDFGIKFGHKGTRLIKAPTFKH